MHFWTANYIQNNRPVGTFPHSVLNDLMELDRACCDVTERLSALEGLFTAPGPTHRGEGGARNDQAARDRCDLLAGCLSLVIATMLDMFEDPEGLEKAIAAGVPWLDYQPSHAQVVEIRRHIWGRWHQRRGEEI